MECQQPGRADAGCYGGEQEGETCDPIFTLADSRTFRATVMTPEQLKRFDAAFSDQHCGTQSSIDVDSAIKLLVDLRAEVSQEQIDELMERADVGIDGKIQKHQVFEAATAVCDYELEKEQMSRAFRLLDRDGNGFIMIEQLKSALQEGENGLTSDELGSFLTLSRSKVENSFDFHKFVDHVAYGPVTPRQAPPKKRSKGKKK